MKKPAIRRFAVKAVLPHLPGFELRDAQLVRWPPVGDMIHYVDFATMQGGDWFIAYARVRPSILPPDLHVTSAIELGRWSSPPDDEPAVGAEIAARAVGVFKDYSDLATTLKTIEGRRPRSEMSATALETCGVILCERGTIDEGRAYLIDAMTRLESRRWPKDNRHAVAALTRQRLRVAQLLESDENQTAELLQEWAAASFACPVPPAVM